MIKFDNEVVVGWESVIRSVCRVWGVKSDSYWKDSDPNNKEDHITSMMVEKNGDEWVEEIKVLGPVDKLNIVKSIVGLTTSISYRNFLNVYVDITAPYYVWDKLVVDHELPITEQMYARNTKTVMLSYQKLYQMYMSLQKNERDEDVKHEFCSWIESLPYSDILLIGVTKKGD